VGDDYPEELESDSLYDCDAGRGLLESLAEEKYI
jgi:hypothetical protein